MLDIRCELNVSNQTLLLKTKITCYFHKTSLKEVGQEILKIEIVAGNCKPNEKSGDTNIR